MIRRDQLHEVLEFLNSIEGDGYGGMASFELARRYVQDEFQEAWAPGSLEDWIAYANVLERALEIVAGGSTDELKKLQAQQHLESGRRPLSAVGQLSPSGASSQPADSTGAKTGGSK